MSSEEPYPKPRLVSTVIEAPTLTEYLVLKTCLNPIAKKAITESITTLAIALGTGPIWYMGIDGPNQQSDNTLYMPTLEEAFTFASIQHLNDVIYEHIPHSQWVRFEHYMHSDTETSYEVSRVGTTKRLETNMSLTMVNSIGIIFNTIGIIANTMSIRTITKRNRLTTSNLLWEINRHNR